MHLKDLDPAQAEHVAALLDEALDVPTEARAKWLSDLAMREPLLWPVLAELLGSNHNLHPELDTDLIADSVMRTLGSHALLEGRRFGPYQVIRLLGHGGMGSVWLAERADGLFQRQVALKLPHASILGDSLRDRFARERRILAALAHPYIAQLIDAGIAPDGQPYLAIEYVEGNSLIDYCDEQRLTLRARLSLIMQVLAAVQHAHRNLVIHRDLKPSNILVTHDGEVRLLDFGIAKLVNDGAGHDTDLTRGNRPLTLEYASPEQISGQAMTTSSDVYSLGVVLYALLCGQRPYRLERESRGALEEAILSAPPIRPSQHTPSSAIAHARGTTAKQLARALSGDLDTIVLKAIKKQPAERYATADALMQDLRHYLAGEPVLARPDSLTYRCAKFVGRNRVAVAVAGILLVVMALGVIGTLSQASRAELQAQNARDARDSAVKELAFAEASEAFMRLILREWSDKAVTPSELLVRADTIVEAKYSQDAALRARMQLVLADLFHDQCNPAADFPLPTSTKHHEPLADRTSRLACGPGGLDDRTTQHAALHDVPLSEASSEPSRPGSGKPKLFLCVRQLDDSTQDTKGIAAADKRFLAEAGNPGGVDYKAYWVGATDGKIHCLAEAPSAEGLRETPGVTATNIMEVTAADNMNWKPTPGRKLYMDVHHPGPGKVSAKDLVEAHKKDLAVGGKYDVKYLNYWFDAISGTIVCLVEAPNAEAALVVHQEAHGFMPESIEEVSEFR